MRKEQLIKNALYTIYSPEFTFVLVEAVKTKELLSTRCSTKKKAKKVKK